VRQKGAEKLAPILFLVKGEVVISNCKHELQEEARIVGVFSYPIIVNSMLGNSFRAPIDSRDAL